VRAFLAIDLPAEIREELGARQALFQKALAASPDRDRGIRWTRPEGIHLTLKFLGEISDETLHRLIEQLENLAPFEKFSIKVKGFGFFPDARRPRVFWAGVEAPAALVQLAAQIDAALRAIGFAPEARPFTPHLTLARFNNLTPQPALSKSVRQQGEADLGRFEVAEFYLFESKLAPGMPAQYLKLRRFPKEATIY
jgi:2'-5' RNA ligase